MNSELKRRWIGVVLVSGIVIGAAGSSAAVGFPEEPVRRCAPDAIAAGSVCLDRFEDTVWRVPDAKTANTSLVRRIRRGRATRDDLMAAGATQLGVDVSYAPCAPNGQNCTDDIYAVSLPSEPPSGRITWFQAQEACANSGKRLPTNAEWQIGANGSPDPGPDNGTTDCNSDSLATTPTGSRSACVSARGAFDMVGNLAEWVADWVPAATACPGWGAFSNDVNCFAGANEASTGPSALVRGGSFNPNFFGTALAGPLAVTSAFSPAAAPAFVGFRCAR